MLHLARCGTQSTKRMLPVDQAVVRRLSLPRLLSLQLPRPQASRSPGLACPRQLRAVHGVDGLAAQAGGEQLGLLHADGVQRGIGGLGRAGHDVGGAAVADEQDLALYDATFARRNDNVAAATLRFDDQLSRRKVLIL